jgi:hypothetical protein
MASNEQLQALLSGNTDVWELLGNPSITNFLSKFLLPNSDYSGLLAELKRLGPRQVCQYQVN